MKTGLLIFLFVLAASSLDPMSEQELKKGMETAVVRIRARSEGLQKVGTGFIVELKQNLAYIVTAAHVVEGDQKPEVEFYTQRNIPVSASIVGLEGGDPKGLALLLVKGTNNLPSGLSTLPLALSTDLKSGDSVTTIGFPQMGGAWAVIAGRIVSREGRDIIVDGAFDEGNSGGPLINAGEAVGLITSLSGRYGRAVPSSSVRLFIEGWGVTLGEGQIVRDARTNLMWTRKDNGQDIDWMGADGYCKNLSLGGYSDWQLPKIEELEKLYDTNVLSSYKISKPFELTECCPWSSNKEGSNSASFFYFSGGGWHLDLMTFSHDRRALCVRRSGE